MAKKVKIEIVSPRGHDEVVLESPQALGRIKTEVSQNGKWLYLDGVFSSVDKVSAQDLERANQVMLGDTLLGG